MTTRVVTVSDVDNDQVFALITTERLRVADMLEGLDKNQWDTPSLCNGWTVRDVGGHLLAGFSFSLPRALFGIVTSGGFDRFNHKAAKRLGQRPVEDIVACLRTNADDRFTPPGFGPLAPLTDNCIHARDVARPLGLESSAPIESWRLVLDFLVSAKARKAFIPAQRLSGLSFATTDQDWRSGDGPEVTGPSEAVAMAMAGRSPALEDLSGEGLSLLRGRL